MKKLLVSTAIALAMSASGAHALTYTVTGYGLPDGGAYNDVTTTAPGAHDSPYSYYTGPVTLYVNGTPSSLTVYCMDLDHFLHSTGIYEVVDLTKNALGDTISLFDSNRIGHIAQIGANALAHGNDDLATAAQAAIWDITYGAENAHSTSTGTIEIDLLTLLADNFGGTQHYARELIPFGEGWPGEGGANQAMVMSTGVPEPSSWALMLSGFGLLGAAGFYKTRKSQTTVGVAA